MTASEANKVIAEFMGMEIDFAKNGCVLTCTKDRWWHPLDFHLNLNALIPVWEKLKDKDASWGFQIEMFCGKSFEFGFSQWNRQGHFVDQVISPNPQEAAAVATAKAIRELEC